jgi:hypothetical protein
MENIVKSRNFLGYVQLSPVSVHHEVFWVMPKELRDVACIIPANEQLAPESELVRL